MKTILRFFILFLFTLSLLYSSVEFTKEELEYIKKNPVIKLGADYKSPPFDFVDKNSNHTGLSSEYIKLISQKSGLKFKVEAGVWSDVLQNMREKKYDGLTSIVKTKNRENYLSFTKPYLSVPMVMVTRANGDSSIKTFDDLSNKIVSVNRDSYINEWLEARYPDIKLKLSTSNKESLEMLSFGEVDAYIGNLAVTTYIINKYLLNNLKVVGRVNELNTSLSVAIDKDKPLLFSIVKKSLEDISNKEIQRINSNWSDNLSLDTAPLRFTQKEQKWINSHRTIKYVIDNRFRPLEYLSHRGNRYYGISSSYLELIAQKTGIDFVRVPTKVWSESIKKVKAKEADMFTCLSRTPSRKKYLNFSRPYVVMPQVIITKKDVAFIADIKELYGKKIVLVEGYAINERIEKEHPQIEILKVNSMVEAFISVLNGNAYAYLELLPVASNYIQKRGLSNLKISGLSKYRTKFRFALRSDWDREGIAIINKVIRSISAEEKSHIYNKWVKIKYEKSVDYTILIEMLVVFLILIAGTLFWTRKLSIEITKRREADEKLKELNQKLIIATNIAQSANRAKSNFLSNMSHEIRTPMNSILGFSELLDEKVEDKKLKSFIKTIRTSGESLLVLINDILDLSKIESGKFEIVKSKADIKKVIKESIGLFALQAEKKGLKLELVTEGTTPEALLIDSVRLRQIIINLIGNAIKFTDRGFIRVVLKVKSSYKHLSKIDLEVRVEDSGIGIPKEFKDKIFNIFEQQEKQDARKYGGTGLGLSISKKLALLMNGSLDVESEIGKGSTFILTLDHLDIASLNNNDESDDTFVDYHSMRFDNAVILVVDDIEENRVLVKESFIDTPIEVIEAVDGQDAIDKVKSTHIDLILMDIRMPVLDGYSATRIIKKDYEIPIVALTASIMQNDLEKIKEQRFDGYLRKPVSKDDLYQKVAQFLIYTKEIPEDEVNYRIDIENTQELQNFLDKASLGLRDSLEIAKKTNDLQAISTFANELHNLATEYNIKYMIEFSQTLLEKIDFFEVESIGEMLNEYESVITKLRDS